MDIVKKKSFTFNKRVQMDFDGGDLSTNGGMLAMAEFAHRKGIWDLVEAILASPENDSAKRMHTDADLAKQYILQATAGFHTDASADMLRSDPVMALALGKQGASQPTLSRFWNRMNEQTFAAIEDLALALLVNFYTEHPPADGKIVLDIDTTLLKTYGKKQEGSAYNGHYEAKGYLPFVVFDIAAGYAVGAALREGAKYCSNGAAEYVKELIAKLQENLPGIVIELRADSGFADPDLYETLEDACSGYAIKLKKNDVLMRMVKEASEKVAANPDMSHEIEMYREVRYAAESWGDERRVVYCVRRAKNAEKPEDVEVQFIVTTFDDPPEDIFKFYRKRGNAENCIKDLKLNFVRSLPHASMTVNACRFALMTLAYNIFTWFRFACLQSPLRTASAATIRTMLFRIAARVVRSGRYTHVKLSSSWPYRRQYMEALHRVLEQKCI